MRFLETRAGRIAYVAGLTLVLSGLGFWAAVEIGTPSSSVAQAAMTDAPFARNAALGELENAKFARLAQDKAGSDAVRSFASQLAADHTQTSKNLNRAAFKENISLPTDLTTRDQVVLEHMTEMSGAQFDRAYAKEVTRTLELQLQSYRRETVSGNDDLIRNFAAQEVPKLEQQVSAAKELSKKMASVERKPSSSKAARRSR